MKKLLFFLFLCTSSILFSQEFSMDLVKDMKPRNIGPAGMSGRITAIDAVNSNTNIIYVGSASGGLWKSISGGVSWKAIFDKEATSSIGAVTIQQSNPSVVWVGTGESNPRNSLNGGYGVYKSLDAGKTWTLMGLEKTRNISHILIDPTNPDIVYVAAIGSPWGAHKERGVYKTTDGGKTWKQILFNNELTGAADLVMDPSNPKKLIAAMWQHKRDPWFFKSGGVGSGLYITHDGGDTWKHLTAKDGLPKGELGRIGIAIAKSNPNTVYALVESKKNALYKSLDGGFTWKKINDKSNIGERPFYYSKIYVDPQDENRIYSIFTYVTVSEDGGKNFRQLMPAYGVDNGVHPDHHAWWIYPKDGSLMMDGNDGGFNMTRDKGKTWRFIGNLPVGQFYHVNVDNDFPYNVYGGMQDNGSWGGPAYVLKAQGIRNSYWQELAFGDGFDVIPDRDNSRYGYAMSQQGSVVRYDRKTGYSYSVKPTHPDPNVKLRFNWNSGIGQDPFDNATVYFGSQFLHKSTDKGTTWTLISPDLTTNDPEKQKQDQSGGLTLDATGAENYCTILVIEPSPTEKNMIWVGTDDGNVQVTKNGGKTWENVAKNIKDLPKGSWITQIKASNKHKGEALLIANDYRRFNFTPYAYRTKNYGKTWTRIVDEKDVPTFTLSIIEDPVNSNLLFLGTDDGLYISLDAGKKWTKWTNGFPTVPVNDMVIQPRENDLVIATFGRSFWVLDDIKPLRALAGNSKNLSKKLELFLPPTAYFAFSQQPTGSRFGADAMYQGENRRRGTAISYYINPPEVKKSKSKVKNKIRWDSITLKVYDGNRLIRTLKQKAPKKSGVHKMYWGLNEKGVARASRRIRKSNREPGGVRVKPGVYKLQMSFGNQTATQNITVKMDPRRTYNITNINTRYVMNKQLEKTSSTLAAAVEQLVISKQIADKYVKNLTEIDKTKYKSQIKASKAISKKIDNLIAVYLGKIDKRQGIIRSREVTVSQRYGAARGTLNSRYGKITKTETELIHKFHNALKAALEKTNQFFMNDWKSYRAKVENIKPSPFKQVKSFSINETQN